VQVAALEPHDARAADAAPENTFVQDRPQGRGPVPFQDLLPRQPGGHYLVYLVGTVPPPASPVMTNRSAQ
jgi:hypothetical protein